MIDYGQTLAVLGTVVKISGRNLRIQKCPTPRLRVKLFWRGHAIQPIEMNLPGPHPVDLAILAMSHFKLGKADYYRGQFDDAMKLDAFKDDPECRLIVGEVNTLLASHETENNSDKN